MPMKEALISRQTIRRLSKKFTVEAVERVQFHSSLKKKYIQLFEEFVDKEIVRGKFEENKWTFIATFLFNVELFKGFNLALKCYALQKLVNGIHMVTTQTDVNYLKEVVIKTQGFAMGKIGLLEEFLVSLGYRKRSKMGYAIIEFLKFYPKATSDEYIGLASQFAVSNKQARELPPFHEVLMFDDILTEYFSSCTEEEKLKHSIIYLWWRLTKVIPMRPVEFYKLSKDCIQHVGNTYWLTLPRAKQSPKHNEQLEVTNTLQINQDLYNTIMNYKEQTESYLNFGNPDLMLSYDIYKLFFSSKVSKARKIDSVRFHKILTNFYDNVIEKRYGYHASDRLTAGDTRHFAFVI